MEVGGIKFTILVRGHAALATDCSHLTRDVNQNQETFQNKLTD